MSNPTFFFSHARLDREVKVTRGLMDKFFQDLDERLAQFVGEPGLGTIDRDVKQGADWDKALSGPLATCRALVAIFTPSYFRRPNCGKELYGFLLRSAGLGIDTNGALTGVENVLPVRWLRKEAYESSGETIIPAFLRLLNDRPAATGRGEALLKAIDHYANEGMEGCIDNHPHYKELLDAIVLSIREMQNLPSAGAIRFATLKDAFNYDWVTYVTSAGAAAVPAAAAAAGPPATPVPLSSMVVFYLNYRNATYMPGPFPYADRLIVESSPGTEGQTDPVFAALLADVHMACASERVTIFHAAMSPAVPEQASPLLERLALLSNLRILAAVCIDDLVADSGLVKQIVESPRRAGLVFIAANALAKEVSDRAAPDELEPGVFVLPAESGARVEALRKAIVGHRGTILSHSTERVSGAEPLPLLKNQH